MFKLTDEQRQEVLLTLNEIYNNHLNEKAKLEKLYAWDETFENIFASMGSKILNLIDKIKNDKDFEFSKDFWHSALISEIIKGQNNEDVQHINSKVAGCFGEI